MANGAAAGARSARGRCLHSRGAAGRCCARGIKKPSVLRAAAADANQLETKQAGWYSCTPKLYCLYIAIHSPRFAVRAATVCCYIFSLIFAEAAATASALLAL